jgi:hypothetical protein
MLYRSDFHKFWRLIFSNLLLNSSFQSDQEKIIENLIFFCGLAIVGEGYTIFLSKLNMLYFFWFTVYLFVG